MNCVLRVIEWVRTSQGVFPSMETPKFVFVYKFFFKLFFLHSKNCNGSMKQPFLIFTFLKKQKFRLFTFYVLHTHTETNLLNHYSRQITTITNYSRSGGSKGCSNENVCVYCCCCNSFVVISFIYTGASQSTYLCGLYLFFFLLNLNVFCIKRKKFGLVTWTSKH